MATLEESVQQREPTIRFIFNGSVHAKIKTNRTGINKAANIILHTDIYAEDNKNEIHKLKKRPSHLRKSEI